jgi:nucleotide-binding universal stress UspA family protein
MSVPYKKILVTLDGSTFAAQALPHARYLAMTTGATLTLLQVVPDVEVATDVAATVGTLMHVENVASRDVQRAEQAQQSKVETTERSLRELASIIAGNELTTEVAVEVGKPAEQIIEYVKHHHIDLLMMSTHGRTGLAHLLYGSVAGKVLHEANCPVLVIRSFGGGN